jgi:hypothetical protein
MEPIPTLFPVMIPEENRAPCKPLQTVMFQPSVYLDGLVEPRRQTPRVPSDEEAPGWARSDAFLLCALCLAGSLLPLSALMLVFWVF